MSIIFPISLFAQKHDNLWIFISPGQDSLPLEPPYPASYLDFSMSPPNVTYVACPFFSANYKITMSDSAGKALFHSNGYSVFNMDGSIMTNGNGLNPIPLPNPYPFGPPFARSMICLPRTGYASDYYLIHLEAGPDNFERRSLMLSLISNATPSGLGKVVFKNRALFDQGYWLEHLNAVKHANGRDWWVVISDANPETQIRKFHTFFIGSDTVYHAHT